MLNQALLSGADVEQPGPPALMHLVRDMTKIQPYVDGAVGKPVVVHERLSLARGERCGR